MKKLFSLTIMMIMSTFAGNICFHSANGTVEVSIDEFVMMEICEKNSDQFILVDGGAFQMGDEVGDLPEWCGPLHDVTLSSFQIGKYLVTQSEWEEVMTGNSNGISATPSYFSGDLSRPVDQVSVFDIFVFCNRKSMIEGLIPVYSINGSTNPDTWGESPSGSNNYWADATCNWSSSGYRLPTEAEWEYASRGGAQTLGYLYAGGNELDDVSWNWLNSGNQTHPVGIKLPNELNLYDMSGNLNEWCWDWYNEYSTDPQTNPTGPSSGVMKILRGGSWYNNYEGYFRNSSRTFSLPSNRWSNNGFRIAKSI
ncbi:MAG: formylglycine-generating enzyme family protein [Candidatus Delongbacteria bacterium]|nr:formylglycine-generating enzyme family protein [Candidatus Delongbacteria bacterium]MBN2834491.1 formylglycine-generating enzyme family protein [Candidatus Delongbacteria bacterium]